MLPRLKPVADDGAGPAGVVMAGVVVAGVVGEAGAAAEVAGLSPLK